MISIVGSPANPSLVLEGFGLDDEAKTAKFALSGHALPAPGPQPAVLDVAGEIRFALLPAPCEPLSHD
jgi:hypothetical protein